MLRQLLLLFVVLSAMSVVNANNLFNKDSAHIAVQSALATEGGGRAALGIGIVRYAPKTELGITASGSINNAQNQTKTVAPVVFGGLRNELGKRTYFAYGVNFINIFGRLNGLEINRFYEVGPYVSLEQMLTNQIMVSGWIQPYQYDYEKVGGILVSCHEIFTAGGIALNYLF